MPAQLTSEVGLALTRLVAFQFYGCGAVDDVTLSERDVRRVADGAFLG